MQQNIMMDPVSTSIEEYLNKHIFNDKDGDNFMSIAECLYWWLMDLLDEVSQRAMINKMDEANCANIFGPNMLSILTVDNNSATSYQEKLFIAGCCRQLIHASILYIRDSKENASK